MTCFSEQIPSLSEMVASTTRSATEFAVAFMAVLPILLVALLHFAACLTMLHYLPYIVNYVTEALGVHPSHQLRRGLMLTTTKLYS